MPDPIFPIENIDDTAKLYFRVHKNWLDNGEIMPGVFRERGEGDHKSMSTDWDRYSTPDQSRNRAKIPKDNGIIHFIVGRLRSIDLSVAHAPLCDNRAHTDVKGNPPIEQSTEIRARLVKEARWDIHLE